MSYREVNDIDRYVTKPKNVATLRTDDEYQSQ